MDGDDRQQQISKKLTGISVFISKEQDEMLCSSLLEVLKIVVIFRCCVTEGLGRHLSQFSTGLIFDL